MEQETILRQDEFLAEDGRILCRQCGQPRQTRLVFGDRVRTVRCLCPCQQEKIRQQREQLHRQEHLDRFRRIRSAAMEDPALRHCTFENSAYDSSGIRIARNYADQWSRMQENAMGLLFWGPPGTGKTYAAGCIANALLDRFVPVLMTSFGRMLGSMPGPASGEQTACIDRWMQYPLLIIDDLGVERDSAYTTELVYHIIDARYRSGKPMIFTTNLTMEQLEKPGCLEKQRIYQRILERCTPVRMDGDCIRSARRKENRDLARQHLQK